MRTVSLILNALTRLPGRWLEPKEDKLPTEGVDAVIGCGLGMREDGSPSLATEAIAERCAQLFLGRLARIIIFAGGTKERGVSEAQAMKLVATRMGVPDDCIVTDDKSTNTHENAQFALQLIRDRGIAKNRGRMGGQYATVGQQIHARRVFDCIRKVFPRWWNIYRLKVYCQYDELCTQKRQREPWSLIIWEMFMSLGFRLRGWT